MDIICSAYNDGIAFRYWIRGYENVVISGDMTQVVLPEDSKVIWAPRVFNDDKIEFQTGSLQQIKETLIENDSTISDRNMNTHFQLLAETPSRK